MKPAAKKKKGLLKKKKLQWKKGEPQSFAQMEKMPTIFSFQMIYQPPYLKNGKYWN